MSNMATVEAAMVSILTTALVADPLVQVFHGPPDDTMVPDVVAVAPIDTYAGQDGDEETYTITVGISCIVGGGQEAYAASTTRAHALLATVRAAIAAAPTLSGSARVANMSPDYAVAKAVGYSPLDRRTPVGRVTEVIATVTVWTGRLLLGSTASAHLLP